MKEAPAWEVSINAQLLIRWWFIHKEMAWVYSFLPLWLRVLNKIENIIRKHMDTIGTEIYMPCLSPRENREKTKRIDSVDVLMKTSGANSVSYNKCTNEYILNPTHEDVVTPLVQQYTASYKDLPVAVYQIQSKFRNEARAKSWLLRGREFRMKDLYSFHASDEDFDAYYEKAKVVYSDIFKELGLGDDTYLTIASGWDFTEKHSHEFQTVCDAGEDVIYIDKKSNVAYNQEVAPALASAYEYGKDQWVLEDIYGENVVSVEKLCKFLDLPVQQTVKTMLYKDQDGKVYAAAVRGDYAVNELKLKKVLGVASLELLNDEEILSYTWAERGYAWIVNLPDTITPVYDDALESMVNMETGTNKTHYHTINVNRERDLPRPEEFYDIKDAKAGDREPQTGEEYGVESACEVGNIFPLETRFPDSFGFTFTDSENKHQKVVMWSYGIGPSRVMWVLVEKYHDNKWITWPENVAPFTHVIIAIGDKWGERAEEVYQELQKKNIDVCLDDRNVWPGFKFKDAELIGYPTQIVIWNKTLEQGDMCEVIERKTGEKNMKKIEEYISSL